MSETKTPESKGKGRPKKDATPEFDLSGLTFKEAELPVTKRATVNPFLKVLGESYEYDTARSTTVPTAAVSRAEGLIRRAADELSIGVSVITGEPDKAGNVEIIFKGKERRKRKKKGEDTASAEASENSEATSAADDQSAAESAGSGEDTHGDTADESAASEGEQEPANASVA